MNDQFRETEAGERYARAAFELAQEQGLLDAVHGDIATLKSLMLESAELRHFVSSVIYSSDVKLKGVLAVTKKAKLKPMTTKLLGVLAANHRLGELFPVITAFNKRYDAYKGIVNAEVVSGFSLAFLVTASTPFSLTSEA